MGGEVDLGESLGNAVDLLRLSRQAERLEQLAHRVTDDLLWVRSCEKRVSTTRGKADGDRRTPSKSMRCMKARSTSSWSGREMKSPSRRLSSLGVVLKKRARLSARGIDGSL